MYYMKVLLINGGPHPHGCTDRALREVAGALAKNGVESEIFWLGNSPIAGCIGCGSCREKGKCFRDDAVNEVAARIEEFDGFVFGSPRALCGLQRSAFVLYGQTVLHLVEKDVYEARRRCGKLQKRRCDCGF